MENTELNVVLKHLIMPGGQKLLKKINFSLASYTTDDVIASCSLHLFVQEYFGNIKEDALQSKFLKPIIFQ